jgi:hypothetical protein
MDTPWPFPAFADLLLDRSTDRQNEYRPGEPSSVTGHYRELNVFATAQARHLVSRKGLPSPVFRTVSRGAGSIEGRRIVRCRDKALQETEMGAWVWVR